MKKAMDKDELIKYTVNKKCKERYAKQERFYMYVEEGEEGFETKEKIGCDLDINLVIPLDEKRKRKTPTRFQPSGESMRNEKNNRLFHATETNKNERKRRKVEKNVLNINDITFSDMKCISILCEMKLYGKKTHGFFKVV